MTNLIDYEDRRLRKKAVKVTEFNEALKLELDAMTKTMREHNGVGIAASQVGSPKNMFVMQLPSAKEPTYVINPEVYSLGPERVVSVEGCLSIPGKQFMLSRYFQIGIHYQDVEGNRKTMMAAGLKAFIIQHELDHLHGGLIDDEGKECTRA